MEKINFFHSRELSIDEKLLDLKVNFEYAFCLRKYEKALKHINEMIDVIEKDIATNIQAFWVYINFVWNAFDVACKSHKKIIAKNYIALSEAYLKYPIIQKNIDYKIELKKFMLRQKIQYIYYFEDYIMIVDYTNELENKEYKQTDFNINNLNKSHLQASVMLALNNHISDAYTIIEKQSHDDSFDSTIEFKMTYYVIKILFELHQKQYNVCDYTLNNFHRYIQNYSNHKEVDKAVYKKLLYLFKSASINNFKPDDKQKLLFDKELLYSFVANINNV